jgi:hypothetical protein
MNRLQTLDCDVSVKLGGGERSVTEQLLNAAEVRAADKKVCRGAVPQPVR